MFKFLATVTIILVLVAVIGGALVQVFSWVLAFVILLMLGDLLWSQFSKLRRRSPRA